MTRSLISEVGAGILDDPTGLVNDGLGIEPHLLGELTALADITAP